MWIVGNGCISGESGSAAHPYLDSMIINFIRVHNIVLHCERERLRPLTVHVTVVYDTVKTIRS